MTATGARRIHIRGVVQGVGFRPFVYRLAHARGLRGWVLNGADGVQIHVQGPVADLEAFAGELRSQAPPAASISDFDIRPADIEAFDTFTIRTSEHAGPPTVRISPDLAVCDACLGEMTSAADRRRAYPYINCTNCGPRFSIILGLPYDRPKTTLRGWPMCAACAAEYHDPADRRFHAQPAACPACGPHYALFQADREVRGDEASVREAARLLCEGKIVAVKGLGGYHVACDARNAQAVEALRDRKFRKEKPFAVMVKDVAVAHRLVCLAPDAEALLTAVSRPIVLAPARSVLAGVAPDNPELGVMLPYTPLHHLLFAAGAPDILVMTSGNLSSEPIAYREPEVFEQLAGIADAFLVGERPIARRMDDSVASVGVFGPTILRRARGLAPSAVARLPVAAPVLAVGADLKNSVTLVVGGDAYTSQYIGDLEHYQAYEAFRETIRDFMSMWEVNVEDVTVVHDLHPQYASTAYALALEAHAVMAVQHHRAHVASVLAERGAFEKRVVGVAFDGTGYGDDGSIWGGEFFAGSIVEGFERVAHLRPALLPGGDAAARNPAQAAAGFLLEIDGTGDLSGPPFRFPARYLAARELARKGVRTFPTTSAGRLFDTVAALAGFVRPLTFEGQAAMWLEHVAGRDADGVTCPFAFDGTHLDWRPALAAIVEARRAGREPRAIARAFHRGLAAGVRDAILALLDAHGLDTVVLSGGVFQNERLLADLKALLDPHPIQVWTNREVPPNDGGISLGQAAFAGVSHD